MQTVRVSHTINFADIFVIFARKTNTFLFCCLVKREKNMIVLTEAVFGMYRNKHTVPFFDSMKSGRKKGSVTRMLFAFGEAARVFRFSACRNLAYLEM